ncbi:MAG: RHS repeat-associated core domain-containing protein [Bacteroidales bacterium]|nr:RHS repeat-associated core domain-containing protein [Bacteroidales bacterium]
MPPTPPIKYHPDHLGSASWITDSSGQAVQHMQYLPYVETKLDQRTSSYHERYTFSGKEKDSETGYHYFGARYYNSDLSLWLSVDPMSDKYPSLSPYNYCAWNPMKIVDPDGTDTLCITFNKDTKKWEISKPIVAEGNDVFNVIGADGNVTTHIFSEGNYGERVDCLNIDINSDYALGVYHVSGTDNGGTGFYVTPGGEASKKTGSKKRISEGTYPITTPTGEEGWRQPGVGGDVIGRGIRFHYGNGNPQLWTEGCFVLFTDYTLNGTGIRITKNNSISASESFDKHLGASGFYNYTIKRSNGSTKSRQGATFPQNINKKLVLK